MVARRCLVMVLIVLGSEGRKEETAQDKNLKFLIESRHAFLVWDGLSKSNIEVQVHKSTSSFLRSFSRDFGI